ncbi:MAG: response regulator [Opitutaceae bacterium]|nr:response regulator [Opitutaceae bacterium]
MTPSLANSTAERSVRTINAGTRGTLFWVDSSEVGSPSLCRALESVGWEVRRFSLPFAALATLAARQDPHDTVILNVNLDGLLGIRFADELRSVGFPGKFIVLSADANPVVTLAFLERCADRILPQPVLASTLREAIEQLLEPDWVAYPEAR